MHINSHNFVEIEDILTKFVNEIYNEWLGINLYFLVLYVSLTQHEINCLQSFMVFIY